MGVSFNVMCKDRKSMISNIVYLLSISSLLLTLGGSVFGKQASKTKTDIRRVIALTSLSSDLVAIHNKQVLVGVPGTTLTNNDSRYSGIKRVSSGRNMPNIESIISLKPDFVIGADGFHSRVLLKLKKLGVQTLALKIDSLEALYGANQLLRKYIPSTSTLDSRLQNICPAPTRRMKGLRNNKERILILAGLSPMISPTKNSWANSLLRRNNFANATQDLSGKSPFDGYITMSNERLMSVTADKIILIKPSDESPSLRRSLRKYLPQVDSKDVVAMNYYGLINPGSLDSIAKACTKLRAFQS